MAFDQGQTRVVLHGAEYRHIGVVLDDGAQFGFVATAAEAIEDDAGDADVAVEGLVAENQRRDAAGHAAGVEYQDDRQVEQVGQRGVAVGAVERQAVVESLVAFDQTDFGIVAGTGELRARSPRSGERKKSRLRQLRPAARPSQSGSM